jgi:putative hydrolase of the HAD superfamily
VTGNSTRNQVTAQQWAVTLDLWETLIHDAPEVGGPRGDLRIARMAEVLRAAGLHYGAEDVKAAYQRTDGRYEDVWKTDFELNTREQLDILLEELGAGMDVDLTGQVWEDLTQAYVQPILECPPALAPFAREALDALRSAGIAIALISNTGRTPGTAMRSLLEKYEILDRFDALVFSDEHGLRKPRREIFASALDQLGVPAALAIHVGDNPRDDIAGARDAGLRSILIGKRVGHVEPDRRIDTLAELVDAVEQLRGPGS